MRAIARRQKAAAAALFADLFRRAGHKLPDRLAREVVLLLEGTNALMVIHGDPAYARGAAAAARRLACERGTGAAKRAR